MRIFVNILTLKTVSIVFAIERIVHNLSDTDNVFLSTYLSCQFVLYLFLPV